MSLVLKLHLVEGGDYKSSDGRVTIRKVITPDLRSRRGYRITWSVTVDDQTSTMDDNTKREAVQRAERMLKQSGK